MTANQIAYRQLQETERANRVKEAETERSNRAKEAETHRTNIMNEQGKYGYYGPGGNTAGYENLSTAEGILSGLESGARFASEINPFKVRFSL